MSPAPTKEPLLYVNLESDEGEQGGSGLGAADGALGPEDPAWGVPWQCVGMEEDEKDWLMVSSGAALAIGGDYRYIIGPCSALEDEGGGGRESMDTLQEEIRDEEEDVIIDV